MRVEGISYWMNEGIRGGSVWVRGCVRLLQAGWDCGSLSFLRPRKWLVSLFCLWVRKRALPLPLHFIRLNLAARPRCRDSFTCTSQAIICFTEPGLNEALCHIA
jgi:hypothetical protein